MNPTNAVESSLTHRQAEAASAIIGHTYRHRRTGRIRTVTDVVRWHRRGSKPAVGADGEPLTRDGARVYHGEVIRIVLDDTVRVSPQAFDREWQRVR